ncbi:hypothetical protein MP213Fo_21090 [Pseudochrobactrum sp. MP213Fo]
MIDDDTENIVSNIYFLAMYDDIVTIDQIITVFLNYSSK